MIRTEGLTRRFDDMVAVDGLDLEIATGEIFGFLGPNGAGKTTTVRMLAALIAPSAGKAWIAGHQIGAGNQEIRRAVGILTETPGLYARLTAMENLRLFGRLHQLDHIDDTIERYLKMLDLWERRHEPVGGFSKGMRQKVAITRALLHEPEVVFLDEPTSGLDPISARVVRDFVANLKDQGRTIFLCTHNLDEADRLCDRIGVFKRRLIRVDTPQALRQNLYGHTVRISLAHPPSPNHLLALKGIDGVEKVEEADTDDGHTLRLSVGDPQTHNPAIITALVGAGAQIRFVEQEEASLEKVYMDLLGDDPPNTEAQP